MNEDDINDLKEIIENSIIQLPNAVCGFFAPNLYGQKAMAILERHGIRTDVNLHHGKVTYEIQS